MSAEVLAPIFAIVGHPNEGKSSVVSTLAEDDSVRISEVPGETVVCRDYPVLLEGKEIIRFVDTPGFQNPQQMLRWMQRQPGADRLATQFIDAHEHVAGLGHDIELMRPLAEKSGIIYVVDGSRPVRRNDLAEMEVLRLLGNPRMAIINSKESGSDFVGEWKNACGKCFNSTRVFNAHQATYAERIALLESLKGIHQDWEPALAAAIQAFRDDWASRLRRVAMTISDLLEGCLQHVETTNLFQTKDEADAKQASVGRYQAVIGKKESEARREMRRLFKHNIFEAELPDQSILHEDLFTEKTWQLLGLSRKQIIMAAAIIGGGAGAKLDVVFAGLWFGLFTVSGAALGAAAVWLKGENMAQARVKKLRLGGVQISVGPNRNPQFPFVLLDRALLYFQLTINWAHARRDAPDLPLTADGEEKLGFTSGWGRERRKICAEFVKRINAGNREKTETAKKNFIEMLSTVLLELSTTD